MPAWRQLQHISLLLCWLGVLSSGAIAQTTKPVKTPEDKDSLASHPKNELPPENADEFSDGETEIEATSTNVISESTTFANEPRSESQPSPTALSASPLIEDLLIEEVFEHPLPLSPVKTQWEPYSLGQSISEETSPLSAPPLSIIETAEHSQDSSENRAGVFPVGINAGDRNIIPSLLIKGVETGSQTAEFSQWVLPFESTLQALGFTLSLLESGEWEVRSPTLVTRLPPSALTVDKDLGLVISIAAIESQLDIPASFEQLDYAIRFDLPWAGEQTNQSYQTEQSILTEGLPTISPRSISVSGVSQSVVIAGGTESQTQAQGQFSSVGSALGGAWYLQANQAEVTEPDSWQLSQFQYLQQRASTDVAVGSQPTFWRTTTPTGQEAARRGQSASDYWGATYVQRWGFEPPETRGSGGFSPRARLQSSSIGRTITGEAAPGTLVQLVRGFRDIVIEEVLVDSSGIYRFENVTNTRGNGSYQVLLYPDGQLTALPEIRTASFSTLPGQIPSGASALIVSGGLSRQNNDSFLGDFNDFRGGVAYQRGLSEDLTVGVGFVRDRTSQALAEAYYAPTALPIKVAVSALANIETAETDIAASVQFRPSPKLSMNFESDAIAQRFNADWRISPGLTLLARGNSREETFSGGVRFSMNTQNVFLSGNTLLDSKNRLRWSLNGRSGPLGIRHFGNETTTQSEVLYNLSDGYAYGNGHSLLANYETREGTNRTNQLGTMSWRYRSEQQVNDGRPLWNAQLGYGVGSAGSGVVASLTTAVLPGVEVQARYQGVSALGDRDTFQIEFRPRFNVQNGLHAADTHQDRLRSQGGLLIQPFYDNNGNGLREREEPIYSENLDLLVSINHQELSRYRPDTRRQGAFVSLPPDVYRLDLDSAGYPLDWKAAERAYAVETTAGQYTPVEVPLTRAYTLIGSVTDAQGNAIAGQRVEAIGVSGEQSQISVTNAAGVFYLEGLPQGDYRFEIDGQAAEGMTLSLNADVEGLQEINFQVFPDYVKTDYLPPDLAEVAVTG